MAPAANREIPVIWADGKLALVRQRAANFVTAQARYFVFSGQLLDRLEADSVAGDLRHQARRASGQAQAASLFLYDDFAFYRGLIGNVVEWAAATPNVAGRQAGRS